MLRWLLLVVEAMENIPPSLTSQNRGGGTGPADPASAGPIIFAQLVNIHTNAHAKPYLPLVYSTLDGQVSCLEFKY